MKEVSPELLTEITEYLKKRERGEKTLLSFFYKEVFGVELKTNCGGCIEEGFENLKTVVNKKNKTRMENFIWKGGKADCVIREQGGLVVVNQYTCNDRLAALLENNSKYSHLVERIKPDTVEKKTSPVKEVLKGLEVTILTSQEVKKEETEVKKKRGRPKLS